MRVKRSFLNLTFGIVSQILLIALGIIIPRLFLVNFGSEVNGLMASIAQILIYLSLLEAGVGAASLQALYKPVAKDDKQSINSILAATSSYYKKTGIYYFWTVLLIAIIYPFIIDSNLSKATVFVVILLAGMSGAINYYFQGKYRILLTAEGKTYVNTSIITIINILNSIVKIVLLSLHFNIIAVQASYFIITIIQIVIFKIYIKKNYKWIDLNEKPNFEAIAQKNSALIHQVSFLIFSSTDVIILTIFTDLKVVSVYVMYNLLFNMIDNIIFTVNGSITFALGQTYHESKSKFIKLYDVYEVYFMAFIFSLFTIAYILILPFMRLYTYGINDINYIDFWLPILFILLKLLTNARTSGINAITIAGHFKETQNRSILEATINIILSLIFVQFFGIYGVLMGTIGALLYRSTDTIIYANKKILYRSPWITIKRWLVNVGIFLMMLFVADYFNINPTSYITIVVWSVILIVILLPVYFIICSLFEKEIYLDLKEFLKGYLDKIKGRKKLKS
ncbi:sugar isomerase [Domibacillus sp. A3M-37]|uniref:sugar isomerase n=1 Tax=Domibacillus sp. A3M-37 TaxID=2962037 RepID=UPI0020B743CD|nr:sugar isomerase [Domibacillus sp. A3M-37]MCP3761397.1 sugar isomerase [Domibacillus sp. A3M-37]